MPRKGKVNNPTGRKKGVQNKATLEFKEAVNKLIDYATPQMIAWLEEVAQEDPSKALEHIYKFAQFGYPLLSRREYAGDEDNPLQVTIKDKDREILSRYREDAIKKATHDQSGKTS